jgi:guanylate kinase
MTASVVHVTLRSDLNAMYVFISPPSMPELEKRLRGRGTEKEASIHTRMANAKKEMAKTEVKGFFHKAGLYNCVCGTTQR